MGGCLVAPDHAYTLDCQVLPVLLSGREYFLKTKDGSVVLRGGLYFVKNQQKAKTILIQTSLHDNMMFGAGGWGWGLGGGVSRFGCT